MNLIELNFGQSSSLKKEELEDMAESYISSLFHAGQLCGEYFLTWIKGQLICHTMTNGLGANMPRYHSACGKTYLKNVIKAFGQKPVWTNRDDDCPKQNITWQAPALHLLTHAFDWDSPLCRGDTGKSIPVFLLPLRFEQKNDIVRWQAEYILHDRLWLNSGSLESAAYKELVDPVSELSVAGRELCAEIEKSTQVPTYYFLMRYYLPKTGTDNRNCPGCGGPWHIPQRQDASFHQWPFRCDSCRLVSTFGVEINKRLAKLGQWTIGKRKFANSFTK